MHEDSGLGFQNRWKWEEILNEPFPSHPQTPCDNCRPDLARSGLDILRSRNDAHQVLLYKQESQVQIMDDTILLCIGFFFIVYCLEKLFDNDETD